MRGERNKSLGGRSCGSSAKTKSRVLVTRVQSLFFDQLSLQRRLYTSGMSDTGRLQALSVQLELRSITLYTAPKQGSRCGRSEARLCRRHTAPESGAACGACGAAVENRTVGRAARRALACGGTSLACRRLTLRAGIEPQCGNRARSHAHAQPQWRTRCRGLRPAQGQRWSVRRPAKKPRPPP